MLHILLVYNAGSIALNPIGFTTFLQQLHGPVVAREQNPFLVGALTSW